jgi:hypothetical protein
VTVHPDKRGGGQAMHRERELKAAEWARKVRAARSDCDRE